MRFSLFLVVLWAGLSMTAAAQAHHKPRAKSQHSKEEKSRSSVPVKAPKADASASQQLRRIEQASVKGGGARKTNSHSQKATLVKVPHEKPNPPIRVAGEKGGHSSMSNQGANPYKGRLRQKGSHRH